ncbi:stackhouse genomic scaffold, scaffold_29 [Streptomyces azureus]|uniref:Stackhouse genomic scaffold, scaffold_29 n=1 Tax=Streptomyces azureus TaxID=146537 RepID=A0A0K8PTE1_STRAJ|nr:stackhouse genomic scaffold, scaffold_29 [Streptomyces azureus]
MAGRATRTCPCRSTSRAVHGATTAVAASPVAVTAPARAYEPRVPAIMTTALTLNMPIGSRAIRFPEVNARSPGSPNGRWYEVSCGMRPPSPGGDRAVRHLFRTDSCTWVAGQAGNVRCLFFI